MRTTLALIALALAAATARAETAALPGPAFPNPATPRALEAECTRHLKAAKHALRRLEGTVPKAHWLERNDEFNALLEDLSGPVFVIASLHPDKAMRAAGEACELQWQRFFSALGQNERLYRAARRVQPRDAVERELLKTTLEGFEDAGIGLPPVKRRRAKAIQDRLNELTQAFEKNLRNEEARVPVSVAELRGVPESLWASFKRDEQGRVQMPLDEATYATFMQNAEDAAARERFWRADQARGGEANLKLLREIGQLRREYAALFGAASYADFALRRRMARDAATVQRFLDEISTAVTARERTELEQLRAFKAQSLGLALERVRLERWDLAYTTEQLRRARFAVDQEAFRKHLPPQESLALAMRTAEKLFGVRYTRVPDVPLWHPEVQAYAVSDAATGRPIASLYVDLFPRDGKSDGAAVWSYRNVSTRMNRLPAAVLYTNLDRRGLTPEDLAETLLHEFGHAVHNNLSRTRFSAQGGTSVLRDFVEAPSQMLEAWGWDARVLGTLRELCAACPPIPDALLAQAVAAKRFGKGARYARQALYARFDLDLHNASAAEPMVLWARLEGATPLGHVPGTTFPATFTHPVGGYAAGYYGYLWSEVVAFDLRTAFAADKLDAAVGARYRKAILEPGGERPPQDLVREFLGRDFNAKAFFEDLQQ